MPDKITKNNLVGVVESTYSRYSPLEQCRWTQSNIDSRFWSQDANYANSYFGFTPNVGMNQWSFDIIQQPCNLVTGRQRQNRKDFNVLPLHKGSQNSSDQWNEVLKFYENSSNLSEVFSRACEHSVVTGMCLVQPYMDYAKDSVSGTIKWKVWEFNSFIADPFYREPDMSDANEFMCQEYISRKDAMMRFREQADMIAKMPPYRSSNGRFYYLPENTNITQTDLLVVTYYWHKDTKKKKKLINRKTGEVSDYLDAEENIKEYVNVFEDLDVIEVDCPIWKLGTLLNEEVIYYGDNPLGDISECPVVPVFWNYEPWISDPNLRSRSLVRTLRSIQWLLNRRIILNHSISESSINSGWMYLEDSVVNEDTLGQGGNGKNIILTSEALKLAPQKIIPNAVPASDMQLADQLISLVPMVSGVDTQVLNDDAKVTTGIQEILRQGSRLTALQKYFDQWDLAFKFLGILNMKYIQHNVSPFKISQILNKMPSEEFFTKNFIEYEVTPIEALNTASQKQKQFAQLMDFQNITGLSVPPSLLIESASIVNKDELLRSIAEQQEYQKEMDNHKRQLELVTMETQLENLRASTADKLAMARERTGRTKSNIGLYDERESEVTQNRSRALKDRMDALKSLLDVMDRHGEVETNLGMREMARINQHNIFMENMNKEVEKNRETPENLEQGSKNFTTQL